MRILVKYEIIAIFVLPFLLAILKRRGSITEKQIAFVIASFLSIFIGSLYLSLGNSENLLSTTIEDWSIALVLSLLNWVFTYPFGRWLLKQWFHS